MPASARRVFARLLPPLLVWSGAWALMLALAPRLHLASLALLLVLAAALGTLWLPLTASLLLSLLAVLAFQWRFMPDYRAGPASPLWLLGSMLALSWAVALMMSRLRREAEAARRHAAQAEQLRQLGEALRDSAHPEAQAERLQAQLAQLLPGPVLMLLSAAPPPPRNLRAEGVRLLGSPDADQSEGLWACWRLGQAFGPGTGRHQELSAWYLPLRGRLRSHGAALLLLPDREQATPELRQHAQSLCDQMGLALERQSTEDQARVVHDEAEDQATRNALLAAISHDYRTPLATIMSAASSLQTQRERLSEPQRAKLVLTVLDETRQLARMTDNTLQLARLEAPGVTLQMDWESAEELVGAALQRVRLRHPEAARRLRSRVATPLPLLRCDALLLAQLLDNLADNALRYAPEGQVELLVRLDEASGQLVLAVRDRGPGVPPAARRRIFEPFQRGELLDRERPDGVAGRRGAGVGLAACRAIARAHGGELRLRVRGHGGASFECWLPLPPGPDPDSEQQGPTP